MPCRNLRARPATSARRNRSAGHVARAELVFGTDLSPAAIIVFPLLTAKAGHLNPARRLPIRGSAQSNGAPALWAPLVSMLLNGGCGYERLRSHPHVAVDHRVRSSVRPHRRFASFAGPGELPALQHRTRR